MGHGDDLDAVGDRVGDVESTISSVFGGEGGAAIVGDREAAQTGAAHLCARQRRRNLRGIRAQLVLTGTRDVVGARQELSDRNSAIVCLLEKHLAVAIRLEAPDVVRSTGEQLELAAVRAEAGELALVESDLGGSTGEGFTPRPTDLGVVEKPLRDVNPAARRVFKLVGKKVRVLDAEALEDGLEPVCLAVLVVIDV